MLRYSRSLFAIVFASTCLHVHAQEWKSGVEWQEPPVVTPGATDSQPPSDAVVLFDGKDLSAFNGGDKWLVQDGVAIPQETQITSKQHFGDMQLHVEWSAPTEIKGSGQGRGNSGIFLMGLYEVQVLDSFQNETYFDGQAGSIYKQTPPLANAMRKPGEWNTYDIIFNAPVFKVNGDIEKPGTVTLLHNGVLALNHFELLGPSSYIAPPHYEPHAEKGPIALQFHGDPVRFRNIWVRELKPAVGERTSPGFTVKKNKPKVKMDTKKKLDDAKVQGESAKGADQPAREGDQGSGPPKAEPEKAEDK
ncbi:3-keto-disaccharide hydrolase [Fuerstiella marisgermanici]|uniref:3-keto-alpha-glucoside-1,2-lyase/3-keto-2-hydroxy-glucal hydratase domain-containing protein n=1 Tax=Fuerstiella marisgermanici TaxID=1891926 RepID=A0A1P8WN98_9PLAN|nr:DUF1080 domain-containing protein [Fuerstiella marisgermanici]APZ95525.1 hypothetical protein Fuma_05184 [Fuerstiella marisgermanici]